MKLINIYLIKHSNFFQVHKTKPKKKKKGNLALIQWARSELNNKIRTARDTHAALSLGQDGDTEPWASFHTTISVLCGKQSQGTVNE